MSNISNESSGMQSAMFYLTSRSTNVLNLYSDKYSDMIYLFKSSFSAPNGFVFMVSLVDFICPISWYIISSYNSNNILNYYINGVEYSYIISDGNYSVNDIVTLFNSSELYTTHNIITSYDLITNKLIFTNLDNINFTFLNTSTCFELLGFTDIDHISTDYILYSDDQVDLAGTRELYIMSNLECINLDSRTGNLTSNIIAKIPISGNSYDIINYYNTTNFRTIVRDRNISKLEIRIEDDRGNLINLTHHYSCSFEFHIVPDKYLIYENAITN